MKKCLMHNEEYLSKRYFKDTDGDYWKYSEYRDFWNDDPNMETPDNTEPEGYSKTALLPNGEIGKILEIKEAEYLNIEWAVEKILTPETDPEYFI